MRVRNSKLRNHNAKLFNRIRAQNPKLATDLANLDLSWYRIKNSADGETSDLYIYDEIVPNYMVEWFGSGISAEGLIEELSNISANTINVRINSPGGDLFEAVAIYNTLVSHPATINVYVDALAASAASIIAMAGDSITMMVGSQMMIHDALGIEMGNAAEMRAFADFLDKQSDNIASIYKAKAGGEVKDWRAIMLAETWMFADEAVQMGLADGIYSADPVPEKEDSEPEETEETEEEETPEDAEEETEEDEEEPSEDEEMMNLMNRKHSLLNRGFKHAGRRRAPKPGNTINNSDSFDALVDQMFAGRK